MDVAEAVMTKNTVSEISYRKPIGSGSGAVYPPINSATDRIAFNINKKAGTMMKTKDLPEIKLLSEIGRDAEAIQTKLGKLEKMVNEKYGRNIYFAKHWKWSLSQMTQETDPAQVNIREWDRKKTEGIRASAETTIPWIGSHYIVEAWVGGKFCVLGLDDRRDYGWFDSKEKAINKAVELQNRVQDANSIAPAFQKRVGNGAYNTPAKRKTQEVCENNKEISRSKEQNNGCN